MNNLTNWKKSIPIKRNASPFWPMQSTFEKMMDEFNNTWNMPSFFSKTSFDQLNLAPSIDVIDEEDSIKIEAEMPGIDSEDVKISATDHSLSIKAEKHVSKKDDNKNYMFREIEYGYYERTIPLPDSVDIDKAEASFKKGMLWITVPKKAECKGKCIDIKVKNSV